MYKNLVTTVDPARVAASFSIATILMRFSPGSPA
jgi:hypothetical protein